MSALFVGNQSLHIRRSYIFSLCACAVWSGSCVRSGFSPREQPKHQIVDTADKQPEIVVRLSNWELNYDETTYYFGNAFENESTVVIPFTVENTGPGDLLIEATPKVQLISGDVDDFTVVSQPISPIEIGRYSGFQLAFTPLKIGDCDAILSIPNNDTDESPFIFFLNGVGLDTSANELVVNGEFDRELRHWRLDNFGDAVATASINRDLLLSGPHAAEIVVIDGGQHGWHVQFNQPINIVAETTYQISFSGRVHGVTSKMVDVKLVGGSSTYTAYFSETVELTNGHVSFGPFSFTATESVPVVFTFFLGGDNPSEITIHLDQTHIIRQ